jgi:hypothetical protein
MPEHVSMSEAMDIVKKPRAAAVIFPFKRPKYVASTEDEQPKEKRPREEPEDVSGKDYLLHYLQCV